MRNDLLCLSLIFLSGCTSFSAVNQAQFSVTQETVLDTETALMWAASDNHEALTWQGAVDYCNAYSGGGFEDWRMPTQAELQTLMDAHIEEDGPVIALSSSLIWASETSDSTAALCNFKAQNCSWMERVISVSLHALPVRTTSARQKPLPVPAHSPPPLGPPPSQGQLLQIIERLHRQDLLSDQEYRRKKETLLNAR